MPTLTIYSSSVVPVTGTWTNPNNAVGAGANGSYAVWTSSTANATAELDFFFDIAAQLPEHASITSLSYTWKHNVTNTTDMLANQTQRREAMTVLATNTGTLSTSTGTINTNTFSISLAQLRSPAYRIRFVGRKANTTTSASARIDWIYITIDYTDGTPDTVTTEPWSLTTLSTTGEGQWTQASGLTPYTASTGPVLKFDTGQSGLVNTSLTFNYPGIQRTVQVNDAQAYIGSGKGATTAARASVVPVIPDPQHILLSDTFRFDRADFIGENWGLGPDWTVAKASTASTIYTSGKELRCDLNGGSWVDCHNDVGATDGRWSFHVGKLGDGGLHICAYRVAEGNELLIGEYSGRYTIRDRGPGGETYFYFDGSPFIKSGDVVVVEVKDRWMKIWVNDIIRRDVAIQHATGGSQYGVRWDTGAWGTTYKAISAEPATVATPTGTPANPVIEWSGFAAIPSTSSSRSIGKPTGTLAGELMMVLISTSSGMPTLPAGFTVMSQQSAGAQEVGAVVGYRVAGAAEPDSYTFGAPTGATIRAESWRISGHENVMPVAVQAVTPGSATAHQAPVPTETVDKGVLILSAVTRASTGVPTTFDWDNDVGAGFTNYTDFTEESLLSQAEWWYPGWTRSAAPGPWTLDLVRNPQENRPAVTTTIVLPSQT